MGTISRKLYGLEYLKERRKSIKNEPYFKATAKAKIINRLSINLAETGQSREYFAPYSVIRRKISGIGMLKKQ